MELWFSDGEIHENLNKIVIEQEMKESERNIQNIKDIAYKTKWHKVVKNKITVKGIKIKSKNENKKVIVK